MLKFKSLDSIKEASMMEKFLSVFLGSNDIVTYSCNNWYRICEINVFTE